MRQVRRPAMHCARNAPPALLDELHALLTAMQESGSNLPQSVAGKAMNCMLKRWVELTRFLDYPVIELSTNWVENPMSPVAIGRWNWLHLGSKVVSRVFRIFGLLCYSGRLLG